MDKIFLIDGSSMLSTQFYGTLPPAYTYSKNEQERQAALEKVLKTSNGQYVNGVFGMTKTILKLINSYRPKYLAVFWDVSRQTFRREKYSSYKSHRKETPLALSSQFKLTQSVLSSIGVPQFKLDNYEADDLIGTFAKQLSTSNDVVILTKDQDALQLIDENTTVWLNTKNSEKLYSTFSNFNEQLLKPLKGYFPFTPEAFKTIYNIEPKQLIDLKGLVGDKSDGIPGVKNVGNKSAIPLLSNFKTIEGFYEAVENISLKDAKLLLKEKNIQRVNVENLIKNKEIALLSKELATIHTSIPDYANITTNDVKLNISKNDAERTFNELEFYSLNKLLHTLD
ncbi:5'-3' exonuclease [Bacillus toyonensis]|uniref:5'-3' exonuclease n=1 Tax=Bacillus toyonensis TaxID=155322 RepID=UPI002E1A7494|nr:5'-3' exonuclease H3TH domain-containing protein [Bacillus toyonensis]MED2737744.1 5'-3' exonuclease H3TH domain-containing protein [Bacillus toyonensis]